MAYTFQGGIRMNEYKNTEGCPIEPITPPATVSVSMSQHIGAPCTPAVQVGDTVDKGQVIGRVEKGLGCPVHASVSVTKIALHQTADGRMVSYIDIENDFEDRISPEVRPFTQPLEETTSEQIVEVVRQAGISGMGGAAFPTYAKIQSAVGKADCQRRGVRAVYHRKPSAVFGAGGKHSQRGENPAAWGWNTRGDHRH